MFSNTEFIEEWNQIFSYKIKQSDLAKPTEAFVFNVLVSYLQVFNFDTAPMINMKNSENASERRSFLIRFCNYIDHIYKIPDKSHCFLYYDLQHPAPKKTVHMLKHLLNYLFYYNMFKESIVPLAYGKIRQKDELVDKITKYKFENEQLDLKARMIEKTIKDYRTMLPQTARELNDLTDAEAQDKDTINTLEEQLNQYNKVLESLRNQEIHLTNEIVSQGEVDSLFARKETLMNAIAEQELYESNTYAKNQEHSAKLSKLQNIMTDIDKAMDINPKSSLDAYKECASKYKELENKLKEVTHEKESLIQMYDKLLGDLKRFEKELCNKVQLLKDIKISGEKEIEQVRLLAESSEASCGDYEHDLHTLEAQVAEEKEITAYILESTAQLVKATMENCFESKQKEFL